MSLLDQRVLSNDYVPLDKRRAQPMYVFFSVSLQLHFINCEIVLVMQC